MAGRGHASWHSPGTQPPPHHSSQHCPLSPPRPRQHTPRLSTPAQRPVGLREGIRCCFSVCLRLCAMNLHHVKKKLEDTFIITKFQRALMPGCNSRRPGSLPLSHSCSLANPATVSPTNRASALNQNSLPTPTPFPSHWKPLGLSSRWGKPNLSSDLLPTSRAKSPQKPGHS